MSDATHSEQEDSHEGPIKTPKQLIATVVASFVVPVLIIIMLINFVALGQQAGRWQRWSGCRGHSAAHSAGWRLRVQGPVRRQIDKDRRTGVPGPVFSLSSGGRRGCTKGGRRSGLGTARQGGLRRPAGLGIEGQGQHGAPRRRRFQRVRDRPRGRIPGQQGRWQARRAQASSRGGQRRSITDRPGPEPERRTGRSAVLHCGSAARMSVPATAAG